MIRRDITASDQEDLKRFAVLSQQADERSELIVPPPPVIQRGALGLIAGALLITLIVLYFGKTSVVVPATGRIVPEGDIRVVEALEGGVVSRVAVQPGDRLKRGDAILSLDLSESGVTFEELKRKMALQRDELASVAVALQMLDLVLQNPNVETGGILATAGALQAVNVYRTARMRLESVRQEVAAMPERRQLLLRQIDLVGENIRNGEKALEDYRRALAGQETGFEEKSRQIEALRDLAKKKLLSPVEMANEEEKFRAAEEGLRAARQRIDQQNVEIGNQRLKLSELQTQIHSEANTQTRNLREAEAAVQQTLAAVRQERATLEARVNELKGEIEIAEARLRIAGNRLELSTVTAPVAGTVADLKVNGPGALVGAGTPVATIVPDSVPLSITVTVANRDIGLVGPGTEAQVKVDAFPFQKYGTLPAKVTKVLPSITKEDGFTVRLALSKLDLASGDAHARVFPGLTVQADLVTSRRRLISLLFASGGGH